MNFNQKNGYIRLMSSIISVGKKSRYTRKTASVNKNIQNVRKMSTSTQTKGRITV